MNDPVAILNAKFLENKERLAAIQAEITELNKERDAIVEGNDHLGYALSLINGSPINESVGTERKTLRATLLDIYEAGTPISVGDAWKFVEAQGITTTRATVNTTLHVLAQKGLLKQPAPGMYQKV